MNMDLAYRDFVMGARVRYDDLVERAWQGTGINGASRVFATRTARIWAGAVGITGAALLAAFGIAVLFGVQHPPVTLILLLSWPAMGMAYLLGAKVGAARIARLAVPPPTSDILADLARLEGARPVEVARAGAARLERASMAVPMVAIALLAPLTIHLPFVCLLSPRGLDKWILLSLAIVGHAHLVLAAMYVRFAHRASKLDSPALGAARSRLEWSAWGATVAASAVPGIVFILLPPVFTALTGLLFNPLLCRGMVKTIVAERSVLASDSDVA
jgi:hypothetical protein